VHTVARPSLHGLTTIRLAPLGTIELDTHTAPVAVELRVDALRPAEAERIARDPGVLDRNEDDIASDARDALVALLVRTVLLALLGGAPGALCSRIGLRQALVGVGIGALVAASVAATSTSVSTHSPRPDAHTRLDAVALEVAGVWRQAHLGWSTSDRRPTIHRSDGTGRPGRR
jgi:hypothetical protein